jgi:hypothetical protein
VYLTPEVMPLPQRKGIAMHQLVHLKCQKLNLQGAEMFENLSTNLQNFQYFPEKNLFTSNFTKFHISYLV